METVRWLVVVDLDGTLLDRQSRVHDEDREAITRLTRAGHVVSICTGRLYSGTESAARTVGVDGPVGCLDGSHIVDAGTGNEVLADPVHETARHALRDALREASPIAFSFSRDHVLHDGRAEPFLPYVSLWTRHLRAVEDLSVDDHWDTDRSVSALAIGTEEQIRHVAGAVEARAESTEVRVFEVRRNDLRDVWGVVVRSARTDKGTALAHIADHHGIPPERTVAVGDWLNDVPMLRRAARSFAMSQAPEAVKAAATDQLEASVHTGGGVAEAARRAGLL